MELRIYWLLFHSNILKKREIWKQSSTYVIFNSNTFFLIYPQHSEKHSSQIKPKGNRFFYLAFMIFVHFIMLVMHKDPPCAHCIWPAPDSSKSHHYKQLLEHSNPRLIFCMHLGLRKHFFKPQSQVRTKGYGKNVEVTRTAVAISWFSSALPPSFPIQEIKTALSFSHLALSASLLEVVLLAGARACYYF